MAYFLRDTVKRFIPFLMFLVCNFDAIFSMEQQSALIKDCEARLCLPFRHNTTLPINYELTGRNDTVIYDSYKITTTTEIHEKIGKIHRMSESAKKSIILKNTYDGLLALIPCLCDGSFNGSFKQLLIRSSFNQRINILLASNFIGLIEITAYAIKRLQKIFFNPANIIALFDNPRMLEEYKNQGLSDNFQQQLGFYKQLEMDLLTLNPSPQEQEVIKLFVANKTGFKLEHAILLKRILLSNKKHEKLNLYDSKYAHMLKTFESLPLNLKPLFAKHLLFYDWSDYSVVINCIKAA